MTTEVEHAAGTSFAVDVAEHRLIVRLDQGIYRHLVFERRDHPWNNRFELITAPGSLTITGDRGAHTFRRMADMFQFFRCHPERPHRINVGYWAEKLPDAGRSVQVYSEDQARARIRECLDAAIKDRDALQQEHDDLYAEQLAEWQDDPEHDQYPAPEPEEAPEELTKACGLVEKAVELLDDAEYDGLFGTETEVRDLLRELEKIGLVSDSWEWDFRDWDFHFVWALNAIAWGIQQYDLAIRSGLHRRRSGPMAWDTPLPTTQPQAPAPQAPAEPEKVVATIRLRTVVPVGGVL